MLTSFPPIVTVTSLTALASPPSPSQPVATPSPLPTPTSAFFPSHVPRSGDRQATSFILTTSDGRAYHARWTPPPPRHAPTHSPHSPAHTPLSPITEKAHLAFTAGLSTDSFDNDAEASTSWRWEGICFHPPEDEFEAGSEEWVQAQEKELDKGRGASEAVGLNEGMGLVAIGCEEYVPSLASLALFLRDQS